MCSSKSRILGFCTPLCERRKSTSSINICLTGCSDLARKELTQMFYLRFSSTVEITKKWRPNHQINTRQEITQFSAKVSNRGAEILAAAKHSWMKRICNSATAVCITWYWMIICIHTHTYIESWWHEGWSLNWTLWLFYPCPLPAASSSEDRQHDGILWICHLAAKIAQSCILT